VLLSELRSIGGSEPDPSGLALSSGLAFFDDLMPSLHEACGRPRGPQPLRDRRPFTAAQAVPLMRVRTDHQFRRSLPSD
jgi:hypothetical protein